MDGSMDEATSWTSEWMDGSMDESMKACMDEWTNGRMDG
jgi:hypothetical protein